jgi:hypothetical protein
MATKSRAVANPKQIRHKEHPYTDAEVQRVLYCVACWSGNVSAAVAQLKEEGDIAVPRPHTISGWIKGKHAELYGRIREQTIDQLERDLADRYRGVAAQAVEATELGVEVARQHLAAGRERDPARAAANLALVATKTLQSYSLLEGKPTSITENRGIGEVLRSLIDLGVVVPAGQIEAGEAEDADEVEASD